MKKCSLAIITALSVIFLLLLVGCSDKDSWNYEIKDADYCTNGLIIDNGTVTNYLGTEDVVYIPQSYGGNAVTCIGAAAFAQTKIKAVYIPDTVTVIEEAAFQKATELENIRFSENITEVGSNAFADTAWFNTEEGEIYIGKVLYGYGGEMAEGYSLKIREGTLRIAGYALAGQKKLTSVILNEDMEEIGTYAFRDCESLTDIQANAKLYNVGEGALTSCAWYDSQMFDVYYLGNVACGFKGDIMKSDKVVIRDGTTAIAEKAFSGQENLIDLQIADSVKIIGNYAFENCKLMKTVDLPAELTAIGEGAFTYCQGIRTVDVPASVAEIGDSAYSESNVYDLTLREGIQYIGTNAFAGCPLLKKVSVPKSVEYIGDYAFSDCRNLVEITVAENSNLQHLGTGAFSSNENLARVAFGIGCELTFLSDYLFSEDVALTDIDFGQMALVSYGGFAFSGCTALEIFQVGKEIRTINDNCFYGCSNLKNIEFAGAESLTEIGDTAFAECSSLTEVLLPGSVVRIGRQAFLSSGLQGFTVGNNLNEIGEQAFSFTKVKAFTVEDGNSQFAVKDGVLYTADYSGLVAYPVGSAAALFELPDTVTSIAAGAFMGAVDLQTVEMGASVANIGEYAFAECDALKAVYVNGQSPAQLGQRVFEGTDCLIYVPASALSEYQQQWRTYASRITAEEAV